MRIIIFFMVPLSLYAAAFQILEQNISCLGQAYSGTASSIDNASLAFFNPGGAVFKEGAEFSYSGAMIDKKTDYQVRYQNNLTNDSVDEQGQLHTRQLVPLVNMRYRVNSLMAFTFSVNTPFGLKTQYANDSVVAEHALRSSLKSVVLSPSIAFKINQDVGIAFGLDYGLGWLKLSQKNSLGAIVDNQLNAKAWTWHFSIYYKNDCDSYGFRYQSSFPMNFDGNFILPAGYPNPTPYVKTFLNFPNSFNFSLTKKIAKKLFLLSDLSYVKWDRFKQLKLDYYLTEPVLFSSITDEYFKNVFRLALGLKAEYDHQWMWRTGIAFDQSPVKDRYRTARIPDASRLWLAMGLTKRIRSGSIDIGYAYVKSLSVSLNELRPSDGSGTGLAGEYNSLAHVMGLQWNVNWN